MPNFIYLQAKKAEPPRIAEFLYEKLHVTKSSETCRHRTLKLEWQTFVPSSINKCFPRRCYFKTGLSLIDWLAVILQLP